MNSSVTQSTEHIAQSFCFRPIDFETAGDNHDKFAAAVKSCGCHGDFQPPALGEQVAIIRLDDELWLIKPGRGLPAGATPVAKSRALFLQAIDTTEASLRTASKK